MIHKVYSIQCFLKWNHAFLLTRKQIILTWHSGWILTKLIKETEGGPKEVNRFWWSNPYFQGHSSRLNITTMLSGWVNIASFLHSNSFNLLLHRLFLDHDNIFYFLTMLKNFNKNLREVLNTFEKIIENGAFFLQKSKCCIFHIYFQICDISKALLWSKGLNQWVDFVQTCIETLLAGGKRWLDLVTLT